MNKILKTLSVLFLAAILVAALASCSSEGKVDETTFRSAVKIADKNVSLTLDYEYDGDSNTEEIRIVDGTAYVNMGFDVDWFEIKASSYTEVFTKISDCYDDMTYEKGAYTANMLLITDSFGDELVIENVRLTFDGDGRLAELYYEENEGTSFRKYSYTLSNYGATEAPVN